VKDASGHGIKSKDDDSCRTYYAPAQVIEVINANEEVSYTLQLMQTDRVEHGACIYLGASATERHYFDIP